MTKIRVPQQSTSETPAGDYDDEVMIDVSIEGDEFGVAAAIARIREIVGERVSSRDYILYFGFILGTADQWFRLSLPLPVSPMSQASYTHLSRVPTVRTSKSLRKRSTRSMCRITFTPKRASLSVLL